MGKQTLAYHPKFHGECHKTHHAAGHQKDCTCPRVVGCDLATDDAVLFVEHVKTHKRPGTFDDTSAANMFRTPQWVRDAAKPAQRIRYSKTPFTPKPFEVGASVLWVYPNTMDVVSGQVWSGHIAPKTRWVVANSIAYAVHESELVDTWLAVARERAARGLRSNRAHDRADGKYWADAVAKIEAQLAELEQQAS